MNSTGISRKAIGYFGATYGVVGLIAASIGTVIAITLVPEDVNARGALRFSAFVMAIGFLFVPVLSSIGNFRNVFRCENVASAGLVYWVLLDLLQGSYPLTGIDPRTAKFALFLTGAFVSAVWVGVMMKPVPPPMALLQLATIRLSSNAVFRLIVVFFTVCMARYAFACSFNLKLMIESLSKGRFSMPWSAAHSGGLQAILDHFSYFGYLLPAMTVVLFNVSRRVGYQCWLALIMSLIAIVFIGSGGGRRLYGVMILSALATWILSRRTLSYRHLAVTVGLVFGLLLMLQCVLYIRSAGLRDSGDDTIVYRAIASFSGSKNANAGRYDHIHVDDNFYRLCQIIQFIPSKYPFVYHRYFWWVAVRPIPRVIWPDKPLDGGFNLAEQVDSKASLSSSIVGELYLSMGAIAVLLGGFVQGRASTMPSVFLSGSRDSLSPLIAGYLTMTIFVGMRSAIELILFSYSIVFLVAGFRFLNPGAINSTRPQGSVSTTRPAIPRRRSA